MDVPIKKFRNDVVKLAFVCSFIWPFRALWMPTRTPASVANTRAKIEKETIEIRSSAEIKTAKTVRVELADSFGVAQSNINKARLVHSDLKLRSLALAIQKDPELKVETKNIMGVRVADIKVDEIKKSMQERGIGALSSTTQIDNSISAYEVVVEKAIKVAEAETAMKRLLSEIQKTKRRVNALEFNRIPAMDDAKKFITLRLEEMERENVFRLKRIKSK